MKSKPPKWNGPDALRPFLVPIDSVQQDPENVRVHDERNRSVVRALLEAHGQMQVLTVYKGFILTGNARHAEMKALGWDHVAVDDLSAYFVSKEQARAHAIADNRTGELGEWNRDQLGKNLDALPDWAKPMTGFSPAEWHIKQSATWAAPDSNKGAAEHTFRLTADQFVVLDRAVALVREQLKDPALSRGRCLEIIAVKVMTQQQQPQEA